MVYSFFSELDYGTGRVGSSSTGSASFSIFPQDTYQDLLYLRQSTAKTLRLIGILYYNVFLKAPRKL